MKWIQKTTEQNDTDLTALLAGGYSEAFSCMLAARGIRTLQEAEAFLHPAEQPLPDPRILIDIERAASVLTEAIGRKKKICIYGDYDVDGVCATTILYRTLKKRGADVLYYIPSRDGEGYGMHESSVRQLAENGVKLLVTVDNGISALAETDLAKSLGMQVVVTDHHRCHGILPNADAVVCATRPGQAEDTAQLCGGAVAMFLAKQLGDPFEDHLPLAALATVADVMPVLGTNRIILSKGIPLLNNEPGIQALRLIADASDRQITETTLSFLLAPRLNAAGRMGDATRAVRLLTAADERERRSLAMELESENAARKIEEQRILTESERMITDPNPRLIMLHGNDWNPGVIGIVSSRLCERYRCPVLLFTGDGEILKGSGRSIPGIDLFDLLAAHEPYLVRFGGHLLAAGASVERSRFEACRTEMEKYLLARFPDGYPEEPIGYEKTLVPSECTIPLCEEIELLAPFGEQNPEPLFHISGELAGVSLMGKDGAHLSAVLRNGDESLRLVGFRFGQRAHALSRVRSAEVLCTLKKNVYRDTVSVNGYLSHLRADIPDRLQTAADAFLSSPSEKTAAAVRNASVVQISEEDIRRDFSYLRQNLRTGLNRDDLNEPELIGMLILYEAEIVRYSQGSFFEIPVKGKKQIQNGCLYSVMKS